MNFKKESVVFIISATSIPENKQEDIKIDDNISISHYTLSA